MNQRPNSQAEADCQTKRRPQDDQDPDLVLVDRGEGDIARNDDQRDKTVPPILSSRQVFRVQRGITDQLDLAVPF